MKWYLKMLVLGFVVSACEKEYYQGPHDQPVFFEYRYVNHAWGVADRGWLIDNEGNMKGFEFPENYRVPDSTGVLTEDDLRYNMSQTDTLLLTIKSTELEKHTRLIGGAAKGNLGKSLPVGADMGSSAFSCYAYDPARGAYTYVLLARKGDWEQFNQSAEAEKLVKWLKDKGGTQFFN